MISGLARLSLHQVADERARALGSKRCGGLTLGGLGAIAAIVAGGGLLVTVDADLSAIFPVIFRAPFEAENTDFVTLPWATGGGEGR